MSSSILIVFTTVFDNSEAEKLAQKIVENRLAACVQILPPMRSIYLWENEVRSDSENLILIKTLSEKFDELEKFIKANHSYDVPEIVAVESKRFSDTYFNWLAENTI